MKLSYLLTHISYHLHTIARGFSAEGVLEEEFCARIGFNDGDVGIKVLQWFLAAMQDGDRTPCPLLVSVNSDAAYALAARADGFCVIGPLRFSEPVILKYSMNMEDIGEDWFRYAPGCALEELVSDVLLVYNLHHEKWLTRNDIIIFNCVEENIQDQIQKSAYELVFEYREEGKTHNPYDQELREISSVEKGEPEALRRSLEEDYIGELGMLSKDPVRQARYLGIVVITLASRAAIRGGMTAEASYSLSDAYIQKLDECDDIPTLTHISRSAEFQYAHIVRQINEQKAGISQRKGNPLTHRCKDYIIAHINEPVRVKDVAAALGIQANYLSELFHRCEKIQLKDFIRKEKIQLARNLLIYSQFSYGEIAAFLGYCSQSHLGKQFKQDTGMTLSEFRQLYGRSARGS